MRVFKRFFSKALHIWSEKHLAQEKKINKRFCRKWTWYYSFRKSHQRIYEQYYLCIDTIKNELISKTTMGTKIWTKIKEKKLKIWHKKHFYFRM